MPFKWKKTWPTTCALKATPFAVELEKSTSRASWLFDDHEFSNQHRQFFHTTENVVGFFLVLARIHKAAVGDGGDTHLRRLSRGDARKRVLNHKTCVGGN